MSAHVDPRPRPRPLVVASPKTVPRCFALMEAYWDFHQVRARGSWIARELKLFAGMVRGRPGDLSVRRKGKVVGSVAGGQ